MRTKVVLCLAVLAALVFFTVRNPLRPPRIEPASSPDKNPPQRGPSPAALPDKPVQPAPAVDKTAVPLSDDARWEQPVAEPRFAAFKEWTDKYRQADSAEAKAALEEEGLALARVRLAAMADLIQSNPERALQLTVPDIVRSELPASVRALLEEEINTRGDYQVLGVMPAPGDGPKPPPVVRAATINGEQHEVFTYGRALGFVTKQDVPLNGIAVPMSAATAPPSHRIIERTKLMALEGSGGRVVPVNKQSNVYLREPVCSVSGQPVEVAAELGSAIKRFCGKVHAEDWLNAGIAASGLETPSGGAALPTAESSYTEGRKRMLLMRPIWSNYTGGMTTNDALTHFQSFSNYMYEMSYGKIVLAALGKGSAVTPPMTLPGLVADYDNTGLGALYNTCRSVASSTYGYDLTEFDFTYVCTAGAPAADYAGLAFVGGVGFHLANSSWGSAVACHEFGHNLGLNHAHFWDTGARSTIGNGQNVEYGDDNDPMGGGGSPNTYNSRYKNYLGWIHDTDVADLNVTGSGLYRLYCFDLDTSVGLRGLKFTHDAAQNYWLNLRQRKTNKKALMNGVQLLWTGNGNQGSYLLDVRLKGDADDNAIVIGRTFSDPALGFHVTPIGKGHTFPESVDVRVNIGTFPGNRPPVVLASANPINASLAQAVTFSAAASDPNGDTLAYYWDFGDGDYSVDNSAVTTHSFASAGEYAVQCTASDMKGGTGRHTVVVRVGSPTVYRIAGRVLDDQNRPMAGIRVSTSTGRSVFSDSDGSYVIPGLPAGSYSIDATEPLAAAYTFVHPTFLNPISVGPNIANADLVGIPGTLDIYTPLVPKAGAGWRFLDNGSDQGTAWSAPGFNDAAWASGTAPLGYPSGSPINTVIGYGPDPNNKYITSYFRHSFNVPDPNAFTNLLLEVLRDDSAVVYLNGNEVFRNNLPVGTITYTTRAVDNSGATSYLPTTLSRSLLVPGVNYLAGEVHQVLPTSSDVVFDAALSGLSVSNATGFKFLYIASPANNSSFTSPPSIPIIATAFSGAGAITLVEFFADGVKLGEDATPPYAVPWSNPSVGAHLITAVATITDSVQLTSAPVAVTVSAPPSLAVQLTTPADGASFNLPASVPLSAIVTGAAPGVTTVEFFSDGTSLGTDSSAPYMATLSEVVAGTRQLIAVATDGLGNSATSTPVNVSFTQPASGTQIISFGDVWKYLDDGSDQGTAWRSLAFDDRMWSAGPARLGYGGDGEITVVSFGLNVNQRYITTYFRKTFTVADLAAYRGLLLRLQRDDGAAVYLNGVEVLRDNLQPGLLSWNTLATAAIENAAETAVLDVALGTANLVAGTNVIAVEIHQAAINSSDLGFNLALIGLDAATPSQNIYLTDPAQGARFNGPTNIALACYAAVNGAPPVSVTYSADGAMLGTGAAVAPFGFTWNDAALGNHELVAVADWGGGLSTTSAPVSITIGTPAPRIQPSVLTLLAAGAPWRFWDNVAPVAAGWQMRDFNDSAWPLGTARFGWGLDGENTTLTEGRITHYFRRWFFMPTPASYTELSFQLVRDDGAVVYLNGMEIFRSNMPDGPVTASTLASTTVNTPDETTFFERVLLTSGSGITAGTNLLAIELHQSSATSSDGGFDLQLVASGTTEARVYLTTPIEGSTYSGSPTINMEAFARGAGTAQVVNVEFFANGQKLGERSSSPWTLTWSNAPFGVSLLTARSADTSGFMVDSVPVQIAVGRERVSTTFIPSNSVWKYLDTGVNQGTGWVSRTFNDSAWRSGPARLGFGGDGEVTVVQGGPSTARYPTIYFRKSFVVQPGAVYTNLSFRTVCDDGVVVYVNGAEAYRINMPLGPVVYSTLSGSLTDEQTFIPTSFAVTNLPAGTNVIAAEVHQVSPTSSDLGFNLELVASGYEDAQAPPLLTILLSDGLVELRWPTTGIGFRLYSAASADAPPSAWGLAPGSPVQVGDQNVQTVVPTSGNRFFRLRRP